MTGSLDTTLTAAEARREVPRQRAVCFHCGEPCAGHAFAKPGKTFCCNGCLIVHDLLSENGLGRFYELSDKPGVRVRAATARSEFVYLDEPALQQRLLDFTDGKTSRVTFRIPAIHCIACVWLLENLFRLNGGIGGSQVNFQKREVAIQFCSGTGVPPVRSLGGNPEPNGRDARATIKLSELVALLTSIGYEPSLTLGELEKRAANPLRKRQWLQVGLAGFAFGNIMLFSLPLYLGMDSFSGPVFQRLFGWLSLALALPVVVVSAADYWKSALVSLRQRLLTLDVPIALGLAAIYGQSVFEIATGRGAGYCDSLTGLIFFLLCGRAFQHKTQERLAFDRDYKSFFPLSVTRRIPLTRPSATLSPSDGERDGVRGVSRNDQHREERISLSQLQVGDRIILRNRELIPADAKLIAGPAFIDYSFVTGESEPVAKAEGDYLYAGGQQIGAAIEIETVKAVSQSYLTSLWGHEAFLKNRDADLNTLTNRYSRRFTFIVMAVALGAAAFWIAAGNWPRGIKAFTSVLIVACPCALALAAPFTLGTAQRLLARLKVFLKNPLVIERLARVDAIVFDKTGTLTSNTESAVRFDGPELSEAERSWILSLTRHSTHPNAVRINESLGGRHFSRAGEVIPRNAGQRYRRPGAGPRNLDWLAGVAGIAWRCKVERASSLAACGEDGLEGCSTTGSAVHVAIDGRYRGTFTLSSTLRPEVDQLIRQLSGRYEISLLSGDNEKERDRFRGLFGSDARLHFNQSPLDKLSFIRRLQQSGQTVMMVGDGLNDAGAFKQSDVGVAVIEKAGAFSPASDVILEAAGVRRLHEILALAQRAARIVRWSFGISALYNVVGIGIAAAGILSPLVCAVLMPVSSISVVLFACGMTTWAARRVVARASRPSVSKTNPGDPNQKRTGGTLVPLHSRGADLEVCASQEAVV